MENNPIETTESSVAVESPRAETTPEIVETQTQSSSTEEDLTALIEAENARKGNIEIAKKRAQKKYPPRRDSEDGEGDEVDEEDRPVTRRELAELLAEQVHQNTLVTQEDSIIELSQSLAQTSQEAELIRSIHANRIFPLGMPLREQLAEAAAIANVKRVEARNAELARKIQSQNTVSRNTATTHRDPQATMEPDMAPDLKISMQRAGYTYNGTSRRYEKKLPNGKTLVKEPGKPPYLAN